MIPTGTFRISCAVGSLAVLVATSCSSPDQKGEKELSSSTEVTDLIERGRTLLDSGDPAQAQPLFEEAARAEGDSLRTRMWVLRSWMDQGRNNDTLDALDALDPGPRAVRLHLEGALGVGGQLHGPASRRRRALTPRSRAGARDTRRSRC